MKEAALSFVQIAPWQTESAFLRPKLDFRWHFLGGGSGQSESRIQDFFSEVSFERDLGRWSGVFWKARLGAQLVAATEGSAWAPWRHLDQMMIGLESAW
jgi:hypothetical protein